MTNVYNKYNKFIDARKSRDRIFVLCGGRDDFGMRKFWTNWKHDVFQVSSEPEFLEIKCSKICRELVFREFARTKSEHALSVWTAGNGKCKPKSQTSCTKHCRRGWEGRKKLARRWMRASSNLNEYLEVARWQPREPSIREIWHYLATLGIKGVGGDSKLSSPAINLS